ncbi:MAG: DUF5320 domain-containing protein [Bacteroidales bacterium]|jgi:hypothetical protein|nr:DUF5320 domain-containing protein [Bacteroidales bacterium]
MPRGDKTGPQGFGPMTGRRMGLCVGNNNPGFANNTNTRFGFGRQFKSENSGGQGRRLFGRRFFTSDMQELSTDNRINLENEIKSLKEKISFLETKVSGFNKE